MRYRQIRPCLPPVGVWYLLFSRKEFTFLSAIFPIFEYIIPYNIRYVKYMRYVLSVTPIAMVGTYEVLVDTWWVSVSTYGYQIWYQLVSESDTCMVSSYPDGIMWYSNPYINIYLFRRISKWSLHSSEQALLWKNFKEPLLRNWTKYYENHVNLSYFKGCVATSDVDLMSII